MVRKYYTPAPKAAIVLEPLKEEETRTCGGAGVNRKAVQRHMREMGLAV
jgi:hypothetical protein